MKRSLLIIVLLFTLILSACSRGVGLDRLDKPIGLTVYKNTISFGAIYNADKYIFNANGINIETEEPFLELTEEGIYNVRVKAVGEGYLDSLFSDMVKVTVKYLSVPTDIELDGNEIIYSGDPDADSFVIEIDGVEYNSETDDLPKLEPGTYMVRIKAVSSVYIDSDYSELVELKYRYLNPPTLINVVNGVLTYLKDPNASYHIIEINGVEYDTRTQIVPLFTPGEYAIRIKSMSDTYIDSEFSEMLNIIIDENDLIQTSHSYTYSLFSHFDLPLFTYYMRSVNQFEFYRLIEDEETEEIKKEAVDTKYLYILENTVYLKSEYLNILKSIQKMDKQSVFTFELQTNAGQHTITINLSDDEKPYIYSDKNIKTNFHDDIVFGFDLFGAEFVSVSGNGIKDTDYVFEGGILTIKVEYIIRTFQENSARDNIILTYRFEGKIQNQDGTSKSITYLGFISIKK
ncbi:hypothetical protein JV173_05055 [Acholeplasma equirhinis]|uniref:hypothetical protein n=1 Tax=Acholeplasma equirhinis TaxID=555393 RepID=UPI00197A8891|nr:hypothetical protein [Acholeplasma equirhinis]MBN3490881.1 hypothetical protein [Acholeplasma equirhinis]